MNFNTSKSNKKNTSTTLVVFSSKGKNKVNTEGLEKSIKELVNVSYKEKMFKADVKEVKIFPKIGLNNLSLIHI